MPETAISGLRFLFIQLRRADEPMNMLKLFFLFTESLDVEKLWRRIVAIVQNVDNSYTIQVIERLVHW